MKTIRIWDLPTRIFHWSLVLVFAGSFMTGELGEMQWHFRLGYTLFALVLFRLVWGFMGGRWSRFASFIPAPSRVVRYVRGETHVYPGVGHNPLGGLSVLALLLMLSLQLLTGLASDDEVASSGPLAQFVSEQWVQTLTFIHTEISFKVLLVLVILHVAAIVYYRLKKHQNLIRPMITGDQIAADEIQPAQDNGKSRLLAVLLGLVCAGLAYGLSTLG